MAVTPTATAATSKTGISHLARNLARRVEEPLILGATWVHLPNLVPGESLRTLSASTDKGT
jgi:hypothetical protein